MFLAYISNEKASKPFRVLKLCNAFPLVCKFCQPNVLLLKLYFVGIFQCALQPSDGIVNRGGNADFFADTAYGAV